ncbi:DUF1254 domain-containing protein [Mesorhizobium xinjiangense]|uniref:DUF1254 domain-containing protein n=1 Tax=Mesorhizobium xinjiangense TaxID=2678685 RepID=UPI0012EE9DB8|nr:DUF1254 domain-containing protein [Mesorhizobium xinjiangense]
MAIRTVHCLILALLGVVIVHVTVLFLLPLYSERDAWSRLSALGAPLQTVAIERPSGGVAIRDNDPLFRSAACRFDLAAGPVHIMASDGAPFWSVSVYNRWGQNIYSFNDRITISRDIDLLLASPAQMIALRQDLPPAYEQSILVEVEDPLGIAVVRGFRPDDSYAAIIDRFLGSLRCTPQ